ncbi:hypothetical protein LFREDSHE_12620 [Shewanella baltica]
MTCFNTGLAYLVDYNFWNQRTDIITAAVAVIALFLLGIKSGLQERKVEEPQLMQHMIIT